MHTLTVSMSQQIASIALIVNDYDEAIEFYTQKLGFELLEDSDQPEQNKRWVVVAPKGSHTPNIILARAANDAQAAVVGQQAGGRVFLFLRTDDFWRDYRAMSERGVKFVRDPVKQPYGTVAVFEDLYGNRWDLLGD